MDFINSVINSLLMAILISIISSILVVFILNKIFKPIIEISPTICKKITDEGNIIYVIKVINKTKKDVFDIKAKLHLISIEQTYTGEYTKGKEIKLRTNPFIIPACSSSNKKNYGVFRFVTEEDLEEIWSRDSLEYLRFTILCKHKYFNTLGFFKQEYRSKRNCIKKGVFLVGNTFEIK